MSSTTLPNSLPAINLALSFSNLPSSGHLPISQLPYQNIKNLLKTLSRRPNLTANYWVRPILPIALSESLNTNLLFAFTNLDKNINFGEVDDNLASEPVANQAFFKKNISSYSTFDSKNNSDSSSDSGSKSDENDSKPIFQDKNSISYYTYSYSDINSCNTSYA